MSGNCPVSGLEDITQPISIGDLMIISQDTSSGFMSAQMNVGEFLSQVFEENSATGGKLSDLATELADLENRVGILETNQAIKDLVEAVFHVGSKHMTTSLEWNPGEALRKFFGKRTNWVLYPYAPYGVVSENVPLGGIVPLLKGTGRSAANLRIWERLPDNAGNYRVNITPDKTAINEGDTVTFTITMIGVEPGTLVNYQFLAIDAADLDPNSEAKLEGSFINSGSGVNTLTLKTVPNRRNDGDRIVSLNIPSYQAVGTFVLVDSSKALDGVINVLPGTSQLITLAPNQQADVWITGGGGSGGISKGANTRGDNVEPIAFVNGGTLNNYVLKSGEEIEVELWGAGGSTGGLESTSTTKSFLKNGDGESSSLNFEGSNFTAGGGRGHSLSALTVSGKWRHDTSNHEGGVNTVINQNPDKVEITVLENAAGPAGSTTNDVYPKNAHNNVGAGVRGISGTAFDGTKLTISGGGAGGYLKLRIKNNRSGDITLPFKAGYRGEGFTPEYMDFSGRLGYHGGIRISKYSNTTTTMLTAPGKKNLVLRPGQRAEVWMVGNGSSLRSTDEATAPTEYPTTVTVGSAVYKAGGGLNNKNHSVIISSVPPMNIFDYLFAKNTIPTSGLPAGVVVNIIEDRIGNTLTYKITNDPNASLQTSYVTPKPNTFKGYTGFGLGGDGKVFDVLQGVFHPGSNGSILGIEIVNNGSSDLTIPMEVPAFNLSTEKPITIDELLSYDILRRNASSGCVIALIDKDDSGAIGTPTESDKVKVTDGYNGEWSYVAFQSPLISGSSSPYIEDIYWATDEAGNNRIVGSNPYGGHAYLIIKTIDVEGSVILSLASSGLTQEEMGGGELGKEITIPITKIGDTNKGIGSYLIQTLDDDEMSFRNSEHVTYAVGTERKANTDYTNNTDYTITVSCCIRDGATGHSKHVVVKVDGKDAVNIPDFNVGDHGISFTVPPGKKYNIDAGTNAIISWIEMRYKGLK